MADTISSPVSAWDGLARPGRHGRHAGSPGLVVAEAPVSAIATVIALRGKEAALSAALLGALGVALPTPRRASASATVSVLSTGPGRYLAMSRRPDPAFAAGLATRLAGLATVTDQSHALAVLSLRGPRVRDVLAKGFAVDLHPRAFTTGDVAQTLVSHISAGITQLADDPVYEVWVPRSFAASFWGWLEASAAEYGCEVAVSPAHAAGP